MDQEIHPEDLSEESRQVVEVIGMDAMMALASRFPGEYIYIPTPARLGLEARNRAIRAEFNGRNYRPLAVKHGLTVRRIRSIINESGSTDTASNDRENFFKQLKLF